MPNWLILFGILGGIFLLVIPIFEKKEKEKNQKRESLVNEAQNKLKPILLRLFKENDECGYYGKYSFSAPCKELESEYAKIAASYANKGMDFPVYEMTESKILNLISNLSNKQIQQLIYNLDNGEY